MILENGPKTKSCDSGIVVRSKHSSAQTQNIPELLLHKTKKSLQASAMAEALHKKWMLTFSFQKWSNNTSQHGMHCNLYCDGMCSQLWFRQVLLSCLPSCRIWVGTLFLAQNIAPEKNVFPLLCGGAAYQNASLDILNFAQTRAEAALAVACCISHLERIQNPAVVKSQWKSNQYATSWSHKWELNA